MSFVDVVEGVEEGSAIIRLINERKKTDHFRLRTHKKRLAFEGLGQFRRVANANAKRVTHLNLADGQGEGTVAVVILDDLELVLLAEVEHGGGLFRFAGGEVRRRGRVGSVTAVPGSNATAKKHRASCALSTRAFRETPRWSRSEPDRGGAATPRWRTRDLRRERRELRTAVAVARRKHGSKGSVLTLRTSAREDSEAGQSAAALAPMSTHAPLESQWNTLPETRSPTLYENS